MVAAEPIRRRHAVKAPAHSPRPSSAFALLVCTALIIAPDRCLLHRLVMQRDWGSGYARWTRVRKPRVPSRRQGTWRKCEKAKKDHFSEAVH